VPPSIVRSPQKRKLVRALPLAALALETDSPVLGPEPGRRNEPANVAISAAAIAEIKGVPEAEVRAVTAANARRLFALPE
jgi:TatD DNase family protein